MTVIRRIEAVRDGRTSGSGRSHRRGGIKTLIAFDRFHPHHRIG